MSVRTNGTDLHEPLEGQTSFLGDDEGPEITIDPEFRALLPSLRAEERAGLEADLIARGCLDPLKVWAEEGVLLDGHNRKALCEAHGLPYRVEVMSFPDRIAAKLWVVSSQIVRRNLSDLDRIDVARRMEGLIREQAEANMAAGGGDQKSGSVNLRNPIEPTHTSVEAAKLAGVSERTYDKGKEILDKGAEELKEAVRKDEVSIDAAALVAELPREEQVEAVRQGPKAVQQKAREVRAAKKAGRSGRSSGRGGDPASGWNKMFRDVYGLICSVRDADWVNRIASRWTREQREGSLRSLEHVVKSLESTIDQLRRLDA